MWCYDLLGLSVRSELPLAAEASAASAYTDGCEVRLGSADDSAAFSAGELVARLGTADEGYEIRRANGLVLARLGGAAFLAIDVERNQLRVSGEREALAYLIPNTGLALYLTARGEAVLHASAVQWAGRVHAVLGATKAGKTTLAALLCSAGAALVTDDTLRVAVDPAGVSCWGGTRRLRLRPSSSEVAGCLPAAARGKSKDGRVVLDVTTSVVAAGSLASLWFPRPAPEVRDPVLVPLSRRAALERLLEAARVRGLCEPVLLTRQFQRLAALARVLPAFEARLPWGPPFDPAWGAALLSGLAPALSQVE